MEPLAREKLLETWRRQASAQATLSGLSPLPSCCASAVAAPHRMPGFKDLWEPRCDPQPAAAQETFTAGGEVFAWTPFPPALRCQARPYYLHCRAGTPAQPPPQGLELEPEPEPEQQTLSAKEPQPVEKSPSMEPTLALQCCPMCQTEFGTGQSQLDIDGHLAQCLAGSADDVVW
ncbi:Fanconi anemia core complex-associated protein 20 [Echinops telfairi]|uniref:Fanconi anemia core complex-associated protein 20 n=1 Tax=Echinops telfairi TaxID=9371 RepID=A0AC55DTU6_ECHTE|nr:Fanconi anemia core complex-associated protein 20 [Echinops telfairi]